MTERLRCVFDCTVFAQALINPKGPAGACLTAAQMGWVRVFITDYIIMEIRELPQKLPGRLGITSEQMQRFIFDLAKYTEPVEDIPSTFSYERDPDDAHYVNLAALIKASLLVSRDKDLRDLMQDDDFKKRFPELLVVTPPEFLQHIAANQRNE